MTLERSRWQIPKARGAFPREDAGPLPVGQARAASLGSGPDAPGWGVVPRFWRLAGGFWSGRTSRLLAALLIGLTATQVGVSLLVNAWNQRLFDAIEQRSMTAFLAMAAAMVVLLAINVGATLAHLAVKRRLQVDWRQWLTKRMVGEWAEGGRQHRLSIADNGCDNPDGRLADDTRVATEAAVELCLSLLYCVIMLAGFTEVLWSISGTIEIAVGGATLAVHGSLLWATVVYAAVATAVAMLVGRPMARAAARRQACEADFRYGLAWVRENALAVAVLHGESAERHQLATLFGGVRGGWNGVTLAIAQIMGFGIAYSMLSQVFPFLIAAPRYFSGAITLGVLMQTTQAIQQMAGALSWPANNLGGLADWRASVGRVVDLEAALSVIGEGDGVRLTTDGTHLTFRQLALTTQDGTPALAPFDLEVGPGEHVLISGSPEAASRLFRAAAGAWPWGSGEISLPQGGLFFMPQQPYLPRGPLRAALAYPDAPDGLDNGRATAALVRVGLGHLAPRLDENEKWNGALSEAERQRLGFARLLIHRPDWVFIEDAAAALDATGERDMAALFDTELAAAALLFIDCHAALDLRHCRRVVLEAGDPGDPATLHAEDVCTV